MKKRQGFVSNSSSSSFILALDKPFDRDDMKQTLFDGNDSICSGGWRSDWMSVDSLMNYIESSFAAEDAKITTFEQFCEAYSVGWKEGPDMDDEKYRLPSDDRFSRVNWDLYNEDQNEYKRQVCEKLWPEYKQAAEEGRLYNVWFADEDGSIGCELEHYTPWTDTFKGMRFSHH